MAKSHSLIQVLIPISCVFQLNNLEFTVLGDDGSILSAEYPQKKNPISRMAKSKEDRNRSMTDWQMHLPSCSLRILSHCKPYPVTSVRAAFHGFSVDQSASDPSIKAERCLIDEDMHEETY